MTAPMQPQQPVDPGRATIRAARIAAAAAVRVALIGAVATIFAALIVVLGPIAAMAIASVLDHDRACQVGDPPVLHYGSDRSEPSEGERDRLDEFIDDQLRQPDCTDLELPGGVGCPRDAIQIEVIGHADPRPSHRFTDNQTLSQSRAQGVADLIREGTGFDVSASGRGSDEPSPASGDGGSPEQQWDEDRRVEIVLRCADS